MGTFNEIIIDGNQIKRIQYKYGLCWQLEYRIGDTVKWENIERPNFADGGIVIPGISSRLERGGGEVYSFYAITIVNDRILSVKEVSEKEYGQIERYVPKNISNP